jgi:UDP-N-acetylmuramoylalanine--D-glutamate ligase
MPNAPDVAALLAAADEQGIPVRGELSLFASALADLKKDMAYAPKVLAITGTNGKTTTTSLTAKLVERTGLRVGLAGNIGPTLLDTLAQALDAEPEKVVEVCEAAVSAEAEEAQVQAESVSADVLPAEDVPAMDTDAQAEQIERDAIALSIADEDTPASLPADEAPLITLAPPPPAAPAFEVLPDVWVLELSSFQLDGVSNFEPDAAVVLNITQDHLDWHGNMAAYAAAKARIFGKTATMVINRDDPAVMAMVPPPEVIKSGVRGRPARVVHRKVVGFGLDAPTKPGDFGLVNEGGMAWLMRALEADPTFKPKKGEEPDLVLQRLMPADALRIRGRHNASNALAALALATAIGCPLAPMLHGLREYRGEPHRVEHVATVGGIDAIDDSKGTNVGATVAALMGLGADLGSGKLVVILGGDGKGQDFGPLAEPLGRYARAVALIGRDAQAIGGVVAKAPTLSGEPLLSETHASLEDATRWCFAQAQVGDAVLLSPACASLDMFKNYAHRAQVFVETVQQLAADQGELA